MWREYAVYTACQLSPTWHKERGESLASDKTAVEKACKYLEGTHNLKHSVDQGVPEDTVRTILRINI